MIPPLLSILRIVWPDIFDMKLMRQQAFRHQVEDFGIKLPAGHVFVRHRVSPDWLWGVGFSPLAIPHRDLFPLAELIDFVNIFGTLYCSL